MSLSREQTTRRRGVCEPALEPRGEWKGSRTRCQDLKPDLRNSAVRHYRGASGNVAMAELRTHLATERVRVVVLRLKHTRPSSIPTIFPRPGSGTWSATPYRCLLLFIAFRLTYRSTSLRQFVPGRPHLYPIESYQLTSTGARVAALCRTRRATRTTTNSP